MCIEKLIVKQKLSLDLSGNYVKKPFTMIGNLDKPIVILALLLRCAGTFTLKCSTANNVLLQEKTMEGTGEYQVAILKEIMLIGPSTYVLEASTESGIEIFEMNLCTMCLCDLNKCAESVST